MINEYKSISHSKFKWDYKRPVVKAQSVRIKMQSIWAFACSPEAIVLLMLILLKSIAHVQIACNCSSFPSLNIIVTLHIHHKKARLKLIKDQKIRLAKFSPPSLQKNAPKEPLGITILTVFFFLQPTVAFMLRRLLSVCHVGSSKNKSSS